MSTTLCRLCGAATVEQFRLAVLDRHDVGYHRCVDCGCLMTDFPTWLEEAYALQGVGIDVGIASRTLRNWCAVSTCLAELGFRGSAVDFGGATGLFARLMRDVGFDFRVHEPYQAPHFVPQFQAGLAGRPDLVTAFEVFEHFASPREELGALLARGPSLLFFTTDLYDAQGRDWHYLAPVCGQHVFFYTQRALETVAGRHGYQLQRTPYFSIFARTQSLPAEQRDGLARFVSSSEQLVSARVPELFAQATALGNANIARDAEVAHREFALDLQASRRLPARVARRARRLLQVARRFV
jgi:hypothetical protein